MATFTQPKNVSDVVACLVNSMWSKENVVFAAGAKYELGQVVARLDGKLVPLAPAAADDSAKAVGVALDNIDAMAGDKAGPAVLRGAVLFGDGLVWPAAITQPQKASALAQLYAAGLLVKAAP